MRIARRYELDRVVSTEETRPGLQSISLQNGKAIATDGHVLAVVPVQMDGDKVDRLSADLLAKARKATSKKDEDIILANLNGTATLKDGSVLPNTYPDERFPNWENVVPDPASETFAIGVDVDLLVSACKAIGNTKVVLHFSTPQRAMRLTVNDNTDSNEAWAIVMPCRIQ